mmetsp:Transcript_5201/g.11298  ORF Transcript_5201/g.11298 Transcript_5201/m.11298 type:complete len:239 (+) Transcript_5201:77-793(+)
MLAPSNSYNCADACTAAASGVGMCCSCNSRLDQNEVRHTYHATAIIKVNVSSLPCPHPCDTTFGMMSAHVRRICGARSVCLARNLNARSTNVASLRLVSRVPDRFERLQNGLHHTCVGDGAGQAIGRAVCCLLKHTSQDLARPRLWQRFDNTDSSQARHVPHFATHGRTHFARDPRLHRRILAAACAVGGGAVHRRLRGLVAEHHEGERQLTFDGVGDTKDCTFGNTWMRGDNLLDLA